MELVQKACIFVAIFSPDNVHGKNRFQKMTPESYSGGLPYAQAGEEFITSEKVLLHFVAYEVPPNGECSEEYKQKPGMDLFIPIM